MFTLIGWNQSVDTANVLTAHAALADPHVRIVGNDIIIPDGLNKLLAVYGGGVNITRAQLQSPSLRRVLQLEVEPLDVAALPTSPAVLDWFADQPIALDAGEALDAFASENGAGAQRQIVLAWLGDDAIKVDTRPCFSVRVTAATTLAANAWTNASLTFDQSLPAGTYDIVGARFRSTTLVAFRLVFVGTQWRPGGVGFLNVQQLENVTFRQGGMGVWGSFHHNTPPTVDFLATAADVAETGYLDLVKTG